MPSEEFPPFLLFSLSLGHSPKRFSFMQTSCQTNPACISVLAAKFSQGSPVWSLHMCSTVLILVILQISSIFIGLQVTGLTLAYFSNVILNIRIMMILGKKSNHVLLSTTGRNCFLERDRAIIHRLIAQTFSMQVRKNLDLG